MQILDRWVAREILAPYAAAILFACQLLLATQLLSEAEVLFGSGASAADVAAVAAALLPHLLGFVLPVAFLLGTAVGIGRLAEDREVIAVAAAGVSPARLLRVPLAVAAASALAALAVARWVEPAAFSVVRDRVTRIVKRKLAHDVRPGVFYDQLPGFVLYVERTAGGRWENVLVSDASRPGAPVLALASAGGLDPRGDGGDLTLVLDGGELHGAAGAEDYRSARFARAAAAIHVSDALERNGLARNARGATFADAPARAQAERARGDVAASRTTEAYLHRRLAQAAATIPFALLAVPLAAGRRSRRAVTWAGMILAVVAHYLLLRTGEVLAQRGTLPAALALQLPTLALSAIGVALCAAQARRGPGAGR